MQSVGKMAYLSGANSERDFPASLSESKVARCLVTQIWQPDSGEGGFAIVHAKANFAQTALSCACGLPLTFLFCGFGDSSDNAVILK